MIYESPDFSIVYLVTDGSFVTLNKQENTSKAYNSLEALIPDLNFVDKAFFKVSGYDFYPSVTNLLKSLSINIQQAF